MQKELTVIDVVELLDRQSNLPQLRLALYPPLAPR